MSESPAPDQTERVILQAAAEVSAATGAGSADGVDGAAGDVLVVADSTGALTAAALELLGPHDGARVRSWSTSRTEVAALAERFAPQVADGRLVLPTTDPTDPTGPGALEEVAAAEVRLVLARLPKALAGLEDLARRLAAAAARTGREDLTLVAGGRVKHMTRSQNEVLAGSFTAVRASRGLGKSRALIASGPRPDAPAPEPVRGTTTLRARGQDARIALHAVGGVFGGARPDAGSLLLLGALDDALVAGEVAATAAVDLGCGNGLLTAYLAAALPEARVLGSDDDADAVASTRSGLEASGLDREDLRLTWDASLSQEATGSADLVLLNPPFHDGTAIDATLVQDLLDAVARVLRPGGQLWFVHNSHLRYRPELEARFTAVEQRARDRRFTVLRAVR